VQYSLKRGFSPDPQRILEVLKENFPVEINLDGDRFTLSYGAIENMTVWIEGKKLCVETKANSNSTDSEILDTNRRFRKFLKEATGYTSKQRAEKAKKEVTS